MAHLIDKDALVAEIERRKNEEVDYDEDSKNFASYADHIHYSTLDSMEDFINTLEVKEVDLDYIKDELDKIVKIYKPNGDFGYGTLYNVATHFFELGLKVIKGE